jgi:hypothetical protein
MIWVIGAAVSFTLGLVVCAVVGKRQALWVVPGAGTVLAVLTHLTSFRARTLVGIVIYVSSSVAGGWVGFAARQRSRTSR